MIITEKIKILITYRNLEHWTKLGYSVYVGQTIEVPPALLSAGSNYLIKCKCDLCGIEKNVVFKNYISYGNTWNSYYCLRCSQDKRKDSRKRNEEN